MRGMACRGDRYMVSGRVVDANDGLELMGCTVAEKDATNRVVGGMTTDMNGNFAFQGEEREQQTGIYLYGI